MILFFNDARALDAGQSGGKGASLARLAKGGFKVPEGFIVSAATYEIWLAQYKELDAALAGLPENDPAGLLHACSHLVAELRRLPFPESVRESMRTALKAWDDTLSFAVRSSATTEDLAMAAFAGQHETFLNCRGEEEIADKIKECWLSLWSERAVDYRRRAGFGLDAASMAVVVQRLVNSAIAGVGFSMDPVSGRTDHLVFDANYGLGESVVSGATEVDHYVLDKATLEILRSDIGRKTVQIVRGKQGTHTVTIPEGLQEKTCLAPSALKDLGEILVAVEEFYAHPVDMEWAWAENHFWVLQARPITRIPPRWTRDESAERFPNAVTPLTWDFVGRGFHKSLNHSLSLMGMPPYHDAWFSLFDHYIYGNQNAVEIYAERLPFTLRSPEDFMDQLPALVERFAWVWELPVYWSQNLDRYLVRLGRLDTRIEQTESLKNLWPLLLELQRIGEEYFLPNIAISITQRSLHKLLFLMLAWIVGENRATEVLDALMANCDTKTGAVNRSLLAIAAEIRRIPDLAARILEKEAKTFLAEGGFSDHPGLENAFKLFMEDHGHREVEYDPYMPTWLEAPHHVVEHLRALVAYPPENEENSPRISSSEAEEELLTLVPMDLKVVVREVIRLTRTYTSLDDLEHYQTTRLYLPFRRLMQKMGRELAAGKLVDEPMDIFFSRIEDLGEAIRSGEEKAFENLAGKIAAEKKAYLRHQAMTPPWILGQEEDTSISDEEGLHGTPGSPGEAEGPVFIVRSPDDFALFPEKAVLVARTTNPAWTPLFYKAVAVVTESGGPLSHGAVTAREMGLPAVMAVRGVLDQLVNGQQVRVWGQRGLVEVLER